MDDAPLTPLLRVEGVVRAFGDRVVTRALDGVDLELRRGELVALIGPSGSGKSTLLNVVGLLDRPTSGRVWLEGRDTSTLDDRELTALRGHSLGFVFQAHLLLAAFDAVENVMMPSYAAAGTATPEMRERAEAVLRDVGLGDKLHAKPNELSGGQQQRVAIARALAHGPSLVLADEPTGNLDTASSDEAFALMRRLNRDLGTTFLVVTHDPRIAARCGRVVEIRDGTIVADRPAPDAQGASGSG